MALDYNPPSILEQSVLGALVLLIAAFGAAWFKWIYKPRADLQLKIDAADAEAERENEATRVKAYAETAAVIARLDSRLARIEGAMNLPTPDNKDQQQ